MRSLLYERYVYLTSAKPSQPIYLAAPLGPGVETPDLFQTYFRFGNLSSLNEYLCRKKRRTLLDTNSGPLDGRKFYWAEMSSPEKCQVYLAHVFCHRCALRLTPLIFSKNLRFEDLISLNTFARRKSRTYQDFTRIQAHLTDANSACGMSVYLTSAKST